MPYALNPDLEAVGDPNQLPLPGVIPPGEDTLATITTLARRLVALDDEIALVTANLERLAKEHRDIAEQKLPDLLNGVGLSELTAHDGRKITLKTDYYASISKARAAEAFDWLRARNMAGVIKEEVTVPPAAREQLTARLIPFETRESIHPSTLRALVKEQLEADPNFPRELFGVHVVDKVVVKN